MRCSEYQNQISSFLNGTLRPADAELLGEHIAKCLSCRVEILSSRLSAPNQPPISLESPNFWGPMDAAIEAELEREEAKVFRLPGWLTQPVETRRLTLLLYVMALISTLFWGFSRVDADSTPTQEPAAATSPSEAMDWPQGEREIQNAQGGMVQPTTYVPAHGSL